MLPLFGGFFPSIEGGGKSFCGCSHAKLSTSRRGYEITSRFDNLPKEETNLISLSVTNWLKMDHRGFTRNDSLGGPKPDIFMLLVMRKK